ncbi:hypothetical protein AVEN_129981-1 [Araneus ventricosus]|uniref:Mutator-like transposase domain-containing protein n=1 Tax=Araneus ventricosus TaxID=182803 RepID=A0A4Y2U683_ARAVE|nr:hypothetical protein AVEN_129981-1 [Araneus ventricosus]
MESVEAFRIFKTSLSKRELQYTEYYEYGDSKAFLKVKNIYGEDTVTKLECIGPVQKRVGSRLRKLKKKTKGLSGKVERPPTGALRNFGDGVPAQVLSSSSDRSSKLPGSSQNSPRVSSKWDVNVTELVTLCQLTCSLTASLCKCQVFATGLASDFLHIRLK